jgi:DtxR family Mn-dependent transcriptional regulator
MAYRMTTRTPISWAMQRYAAEIWRLEREHPPVSLGSIAEHANVSTQAVSRMVRRLEEAGLVRHERYHGVKLTARGERACLPAIRRHRLVECFLVQVMGFDWAEVHDLADDFEHGVDERIEARIDELTGYPTRCPHGDPIPSADGVLPVVDDAPLSEIARALLPGQRGEVSRVKTHDPERLRYLKDVGLVPGVGFQFRSAAPFDGPVTLEIEGVERVVGNGLARELRVTMASPAKENGYGNAT